MGKLKIYFLAVDLGLISYWICVIFELISPEFLFKDYYEPIMKSWNYSFLPLDLAVSATGLYAVYRHAQHDSIWRPFALISLTLTSCSGLQAISFWALRHDFDLMWWAPNLFLMFYPLFFMFSVLGKNKNKDISIGSSDEITVS